MSEVVRHCEGCGRRTDHKVTSMTPTVRNPSSGQPVDAPPPLAFSKVPLNELKQFQCKVCGYNITDMGETEAKPDDDLDRLAKEGWSGQP